MKFIVDFNEQPQDVVDKISKALKLFELEIVSRKLNIEDELMEFEIIKNKIHCAKSYES